MEQVTEPDNKFLEVFQTKMEPEKRFAFCHQSHQTLIDVFSEGNLAL